MTATISVADNPGWEEVGAAAAITVMEGEQQQPLQCCHPWQRQMVRWAGVLPRQAKRWYLSSSLGANVSAQNNVSIKVSLLWRISVRLWMEAMSTSNTSSLLA
jgi:hypothetical protein